MSLNPRWDREDDECQCERCQIARDFNKDEDERLNAFIRQIHAKSCWLSGDREYYPIWSETLYEQDQIWRTKFDLRTSEQRIEHLAQEASLYVLSYRLSYDD